MGNVLSVRDPTHVTPKGNLCMHTMFFNLSHQGVVWPSTIFFGGTDMDTEMGVVIYIYIYMYLKLSPDSKYIWVHGLTTYVQVFLLMYHFWHF